MNIKRLCRWTQSVLPILACAWLVTPARAATTMQFWFPKENDLSTTLDDETFVKNIKWGAASQPIKWVLMKPGNGPVLLPTTNTNNIQDSDILFAMQRALAAWDNNSFANFTYDLGVYYSTSPFVTNPKPLDAILDGWNVVDFQSQVLSLGDGVLAITSQYFLEHAISVQEFTGVPADEVQSGLLLPVDLDLDGNADINLPARDYAQGEMIETDIIFNSALTYVLWPENLSDVPPQDINQINGSIDIQEILTHELGHAAGVGHTYIQDSTMTPFLRPSTDNFPTNPYNARVLKFDDMLGLALVYGDASASGTGQIAGHVFNGENIALLLPTDDPDNLPPEKTALINILDQPVFLGIPAPPGQLNPDNIGSEAGEIRLIAQVLTSQNMNFPLLPGTGGAGVIVPAADVLPNIDLSGTGEDVNGNGIMDPGEDRNANGILDPSTLKLDSIYRFTHLPPREDYVVYIDQALGGSAIAISNVNLGFSGLSSFPPEFYGGTAASAPTRDAATQDDPLMPEFITVTADTITTPIDVVTNTEDFTGGTGTPEQPPGTPAPPPKFVVQPGGSITPSNFIALGADMGDLNGDGYLDIVVAVFEPGSDVGAGLANRVYLNVPSDPSKPNSPRMFKDITFGADGLPGTLDDVLAPKQDHSRDVKLGDFNNDGRLDLIVSNAGNDGGLIAKGYLRLYLNEPDPSSPYGFRFMEISDVALPGLLNRGQGPLFPDGWANYSRIAVGDIDGDGDLDIIVSLLTPQDDHLSNGVAPTNPYDATVAMIDTQPASSSTTFPNGDGYYSSGPGVNNSPPAGDQITAPSVLNNFRDVSKSSFFHGGPLVFCEEVLINKFYDALTPMGTPVFVDETLGADNRFGDSSLTVFDANNSPPTGPLHIPRFDGTLTFTANTDRVPPVFPPTWSFDSTGAATSSANSPMGWHAFEPRLGPIFADDGLDLISVRGFQDEPVPPPTPSNLAQSAFYQNMDINNDGIADGVFACLNYGLDFSNLQYTYRTGSGLFPLRDKGSTVTMELQPLLIGLPDGTPGDVEDYTAPTGFPEKDIFERINRGGFTGTIADWEYRGVPKPAIISDTEFGTPFWYKPLALPDFANPDRGAERAQDGFALGRGISFNPTTIESISFVRPLGGGIINPHKEMPGTFGEPHGVAVADFDNNGSPDLAIAETVVHGFDQIGGLILVDVPVQHQIFSNDGFGNFTDVTSTQLPSTTVLPPKVSYVPLAGDIDNDADNDLVFINALGSHDVLFNNIYDPAQPPDPKSTVDPTMFYDQTPRFIPPLYGSSLIPPFGAGALNGVTTSVVSGDFNGDGWPDIATADGGIFSIGSYPQLQINSGAPRQEPGRPFNDGMTIFKPYGAGFPSPRLQSDPFRDFNGYLWDTMGEFFNVSTGLGAYYGVSTADFSGDGTSDLFFSRSGQGPVCHVNVDSSVAYDLLSPLLPLVISSQNFFNSRPDPDLKGDGVFINLKVLELALSTTLMPDLTDPCPDPSGSIVLKNMGRRLAVADFNGDGSADVCIANGLDGTGAPNALLFNYPFTIFPYPVPFPRFFDMTESNLPTAPGFCGAPTGIYDNTYDIAAADFDHDGHIDMIFANQTDSSTSTFPGFRFLKNDGFGNFTDVVGNVPEFKGNKPRSIVIGDFDGVGEWTNDFNHNGILDPGEDIFGDGLIHRSEDKNGNGILDPGEDLNGNGILDNIDLPDETVAGDINGDGIITKRHAGIWEPSFDLFITFEDRPPALLINDPTNNTPGVFSDETAIRLPALAIGTVFPTEGARAGDMNNDGFLDIVAAKHTFNSYTTPVTFYLNDGHGVFKDASYEFPFPTSVRGFNETGPASISFTGNAADVELLDVDHDGDLDVYVGMSGVSSSVATIGALNIFYVNRTVGGNFNTGNVAVAAMAPPSPGPNPPLVFAADPDKGMQGANVSITLAGAHFTPTTQIALGNGITVNTANFVNPNRITVNVNIAPAAQVGPRKASASDSSSGLSSDSNNGLFNVTSPPPNSVSERDWRLYE